MSFDICLDASSLLDRPTGVGRYTNALIESLSKIDLDNHYKLLFYSLKKRYQGNLLSADNISARHWRIPGRLLLKLWQRWDFPAIEHLVGRIDLFHSPNFFYQALKHAKTVATIHDLAFMRDATYGEKYGGAYFRKVLARKIEQVDALIAVSRHTASDLVEFFEVPEEQIRVIYEGVGEFFYKRPDEAFIKQVLGELGIGDYPYILCTATLEPRKNLTSLIKAFRQLPVRYSDHRLVIVGKPGWGFDGILEEISPELAARIHITGYICDEYYRVLLKNAVLFVLPSLYEGFGLPVLEAMASGTPVACSNTSSLPEIAGEAAAYFDPFDIDSMIHIIDKMLDDEQLRGVHRQAGLQRAGKFTWEKAAKETLDLYRELLR